MDQMQRHISGSPNNICDKIDEVIPSCLEGILLRVAEGKAAVTDVQLRDDNETDIGESKVRDALVSRDDQITLWVNNLKREINNLTDQHDRVQNCIEETLNRYWHFDNILEISRMCLNYRKDLECGDPSDEVNRLLEKEVNLATSALDEIYSIIKQLRSFLGRFEHASNTLRTDSRLKALADNCVKSCQQAKPLLGKPYTPEEVMKPYHRDTELEWEKYIHEHIMTTTSLRLESRDYCTLAADLVEKYTGDLASAWTQSDHALNEEINEDEHMLDFIHKTISQMDKEINASHLRMATFHDEFERQNLQKGLEAWRLQRLNHRPETENIRDRTIHSLEEEMSEIQNRMDKISVDFKSDCRLNKDMENLRNEQIRKMGVISKRLFADRENCRGLRRTVIIEGRRKNGK